MFNQYQIKKREEQKSRLASISETDQSLKLKKKALRDKMAENSKGRRQEWLTKVASEDTFKKHFLYGSQQFHTDYSKSIFRDEDPSKFFGKRNVMAFKSQTTKQRSDQAEKEYRERHLQQTPYQPKDAIRNPTEAWLRSREKSEEKNNFVSHGLKNEMARVTMSMNSTKNTFEPLDTKALFFPKRRDDSHQKWITDKVFVTMSGKKDKPWTPTPIIDPSSFKEPYKERVASITGQRNTLKEIGENEWDGFSRKDSIWSQRMMASDSTRTYMSIQGQIKSINGLLQPASSLNSARDTISSLKSSPKKNKQQTRFISRVQAMHQAPEEIEQKFEAPVPTTFSIRKGDLKKVEEYLTIKKEFTQKSSLLYLPQQQLPQTLNQRFKGPLRITDQYLEDRILQSKQKMYYKSAETEVLSKQVNGAPANVTASLEKSSSISVKDPGMHDIVNQIDIGKLLLNEKMDKPISKDHSPLVSAKRQLSLANSEEALQGNDSGLLHQQSFDSVKKEERGSPVALRLQNQLQRAEKIQEESDETDEDSPLKKDKKRSGDAQDTNLIIENQGTPMSQVHMASLRSSLKRNSSQMLEIKKKEFYQLNPTLQKEERSTQLKQMMNVFFIDENQKTPVSSKNSLSRRL